MYRINRLVGREKGGKINSWGLLQSDIQMGRCAGISNETIFAKCISYHVHHCCVPAILQSMIIFHSQHNIKQNKTTPTYLPKNSAKPSQVHATPPQRPTRRNVSCTLPIKHPTYPPCLSTVHQTVHVQRPDMQHAVCRAHPLQNAAPHGLCIAEAHVTYVHGLYVEVHCTEYRRSGHGSLASGCWWLVGRMACGGSGLQNADTTTSVAWKSCHATCATRRMGASTQYPVPGYVYMQAWACTDMVVVRLPWGFVLFGRP